MFTGGVAGGRRAGLDGGDGVNLRAWFLGYLAWLGGLTAAACWGLREMDGGGSAVGWTVWLLAGYAFYLSLCCTLFPAPTTWAVMLLASDIVAAQVGLEGHRLARLMTVATVGALATGAANLNEYHVFVYLLRRRGVARIRDTRLYHVASRWFSTNPFWILTLFSFLPIPVDVIRWLAITARYSRLRFFWASLVGRWFRYAIWALAAVGMHLSGRQIMIVQGVLVLVALVRILPRLVRRGRRVGADMVDGLSVTSESVLADDGPIVVGDGGRA